MGRVLLALSLVFVAAVVACGETAKKQDWQSSYFEESEFRSGASSSTPTVYLRDGYLPFVRSEEERLAEDPLPKGAGAVVIYCYVQSSGGKVRGHSGMYALAGVAVQLSDGERRLVLRTDRNGYLVAALPAGHYEVSVKGIVRKAAVEKGKSILLPIRAGKRMVD